MNGYKGDRFTVTGIAYPQVHAGAGPANPRITSDISDPQSYYHDPALRLTEHDLDRNQNFTGTPLCVEHRHPATGHGRCDNCAGEVLEARVLKDSSVYIVASVYANTPAGDAAKARILNKELSGFSMGYLNHRDGRTVTKGTKK
jgi:hypothetical protein